MKYCAPLFSLLLLASCAQVSPPAPDVQRELASVTPARRFLQAALKAEDNILFRTVKEMDDRLVKEIQANPAKFGMQDDAARKLRSLDDIQNERIIAEVLSEAPQILKFSNRARQASMKAIMDEVGIASQISIKSLDNSAIKLAASEQTGLGRDVSLRLKGLKNRLVENRLASEAQAEKIYRNLFQAAKDLSAKAKGDPAQMVLARQIVDYSTIISERTGKQFLGEGGCLKIGGREVLENKADIAFRTMADVEAHRFNSYEDIGRALQKNHAEVTGRTKREACLAIQALSIGRACGGIYAKQLAPPKC
jgi:hypothetical protein